MAKLGNNFRKLMKVESSLDRDCFALMLLIPTCILKFRLILSHGSVNLAKSDFFDLASFKYDC